MTQNINLIEDLNIRPVSAFNSKLMAQVTVVWVLLLFLIYAININIDSHKANTITKLERTEKELMTKVSSYSQGFLPVQGTSEANLENIPATSTKNIDGFYGYLEDLAKYTLQGVWLTDISFTGNKEITLKGKAISASGVSSFLNSLGSAKNLENKNLGTLELKKEPDLDITTFIISSVVDKQEKTDEKK